MSKVMVNGYTHNNLTFLEGRLLTMIDSALSDERQCKALKDLVSSELWWFWEHPQYSEEKEEMFKQHTGPDGLEVKYVS